MLIRSICYLQVTVFEFCGIRIAGQPLPGTEAYIRELTDRRENESMLGVLNRKSIVRMVIFTLLLTMATWVIPANMQDVSADSKPLSLATEKANEAPDFNLWMVQKMPEDEIKGLGEKSATDAENTLPDTEENDDQAQTVEIKKTMRVNQIAQWQVDVYHKQNWKSSKKSIASVNKYGVIKAKKVGKTKITVTVDGITYICNLTVKKSNFKPVPIKKLKNYKSLKGKMTDAEFKKAYKKALKVVKPLGDLSKKEQLYGIAATLREMFDSGKVTYSSSAAHYNDAYGYFVRHVASCAGCTRATGLCLNILGIKYEHVNENKYKHQWCRVKVGKKYWICDAYGLYCGPEPGKRKHPYF